MVRSGQGHQYITTFNDAFEYGRTPGSVKDAWINEDTQMKEMYANRIGIAGETWCQIHGALLSLSEHEYEQN